MEIREVAEDDLAELLVMNNAAVPNVDAHATDTFAARAALAQLNLVAVRGSELLGFVMSAYSGGDFPSENYRWFAPRFTDFHYVDRIVVAAHARGLGVGAALYDELFTRTEVRVACEVNLEPPNPGSLRFHHRLGFTEVGQQHTEGGTTLVSMLVREAGRR